MSLLQNKKTEACELRFVVILFRDPAGARTQDPNIKSVVLYLLSYEINAKLYGLIRFGGAKV